jgi:2-polyprenyl-3-methyl-5-hydroxy-6-metoxy-1,4-benzoquinol methylase
MTQREYWEQVYTNNPLEKLGWYLSHLETSLQWIQNLKLNKDSNIIDVGGGASTLVDDLLDDGFRSITVVDLSKKALSIAQERLGQRAGLVSWMAEDIISVPLAARQYDLWHDRAVLHFLTTPAMWRQYRNNLLKALRPGGHVVLGTFALEAPAKCSGLSVKRYSADELERKLGEEFELIRHDKYLHITPRGVEQMYLYCHFQKSI